MKYYITEPDMRNIFLASLIAISLALPSPARAGDGFDTLYQVSSISNLMAGAYAGTETVGELLAHGGFGIGTFDALDGEMVVLDGRCYQVKLDGSARLAVGSQTTPFAEVTEFESDRVGVPAGPLDMDALKAYIDGLAPDTGIPYAVKVTGTFSLVRTRSVPKQGMPYPPLVEAVKGQKTRSMEDVKGTLVGFRLPAFMDGVGVPGYHLHFITDDSRAGGHVLALITSRVTVHLDDTPEFRMTLPKGFVPGTAPPTADRSSLKAIEGGR
ncbi:MAG: acetolactate decarboxylase [Nitrospirae bacterium]|nr:acetolactate decarboxylase [Nitrospirota bacterium]MBI5696597.1 acetolactate decarboxylase [Nitrospirota bacterium]